MKSKTSSTRQYRSSSTPAALAEQERSTGAHGSVGMKISASPRVTEQRAVNAQIQNSPLVVAQKRGVEKIAETSKTAQLADDEELQKKSAISQLETDEELQKKTAQLEIDEELQKKSIAVQLELDDELQKKAAPAQRVEQPQHELAFSQTNNTGLPDNLKAGIESLSGISMDSVKVHYNSPQPAQLNALAYAQGTDIHVAPGQEKHLPHEAWHVVQQAQGRVQPTMQMKEGVPVNDDRNLEHEADVMGAKALSVNITDTDFKQDGLGNAVKSSIAQLARRMVKDVRYDGYSDALRQALLGQVPNGTNVTITQTDYVGGNFKVVFENVNGPKITIETARNWITNALKSLDSSSSESDSGHSSDSED
jgi:hypothetical protein